MKSFNATRLMAMALAAGMGMGHFWPTPSFDFTPMGPEGRIKPAKKSSVAKQKREAKKRRNQWRYKTSCRTRSTKR